MALYEGQMLGPYQIIGQLGQGGMATVYKAYHAKLDRYVAIKVMHPWFFIELGADLKLELCITKDQTVQFALDGCCVTAVKQEFYKRDAPVRIRWDRFIVEQCKDRISLTNQCVRYRCREGRPPTGNSY